MRQVWEELGAALMALGGDVNRKVNQRYVVFSRGQAFLEVSILKASIYVRIKMDDDALEETHRGSWTTTRWPDWLKCELITTAELAQAIPAIRQAYEQLGHA